MFEAHATNNRAANNFVRSLIVTHFSAAPLLIKSISQEINNILFSKNY